MLTTLSAREAGLLFGIMQDLTRLTDSPALRERTGQRLLELLQADFYASYVWQADGSGYAQRVAINMSIDNLAGYDRHYQFCDPITRPLQRCRRATHVNTIMAQEDLMRTEFFNDFLARDGLHHGMNFHAHDGTDHIGDIRIWRRRGRESFERRELDILDAVGEAFRNALCSLRSFESRLNAADPRTRLSALARQWSLTRREAEVLACAGTGQRDMEIARTMGISVTTLRTHLRNIFQKSGLDGRTALAGRLSGLADSNRPDTTRKSIP
jgi:DNA-binding CsgD family transcriptional regulator